MSRYNRCKECARNDEGICEASGRKWKIDYWDDTSDCPHYEPKEEE